ncbi:MAG: MmcQ/YjbR family DNA-binding protein [Gemmatimonadales bacterium]
MTPDQFRALALALPEAVESSHMGHADFRVGGKVFATLGYPDADHGAVTLPPDEQAYFVKAHGVAFEPAKGAWGKSGSTIVRLAKAPRKAVEAALEAAWRKRAPKRLLAASSDR